jgi:Mce-associated membrane protein
MNDLQEPTTSTAVALVDDPARPDTGGDARGSKIGGVGAIVARVLGGLKALPRNAEDLAQRVIADVKLRPERAVRILGIAAVVLALLTGLFWYQARQYDLTSQARDQASAVAKDAVPALLSYNYLTIDRQVADTQDMITGKFKDDYANLVKTTVAGPAAAQQVAIQTAITNESVVSSGTDQVVLLMFINQQSESKANPGPTLTGSRLRVSLENQGGKWLISELAPV